mgnify:CR=1 FL=1
MQIFKNVDQIKSTIARLKAEGKSIAFIPTMGALHEGHLSLINSAKTNIKVCSIFINPTQFNNKEDLEKYPRTPEEDIRLLLENSTCDILFLPSYSEIYPNDFSPIDFNFGSLAYVMEGEFRPGHFQGMANVVKRLLDIITPDDLIMGQKDFQQTAIVNSMLIQIKSNVNLIVAATQREKDGLAMSSRNTRLSLEERKKAPIIYNSLINSKKLLLEGKNILEVEREVIDKLEKMDEFKVEYVQVVDGVSLKKITNINSSNYIVMCIAVWLGNVRLIDNIIIKPK